MDTTALLDHAQLADAAGFTACAEQLRSKADLARKLALAYEFYRFVPQECIDQFNAKLKATTRRKPNEHEGFQAAQRLYGNGWMFAGTTIKEICDQLVFDAPEKYAGCPPVEAISALNTAKQKEIFDAFQVAHVAPYATVVIRPDPIIFGLIDGCTDRFFIAEWGSDVRISDLLEPHEG